MRLEYSGEQRIRCRKLRSGSWTGADPLEFYRPGWGVGIIYLHWEDITVEQLELC